MNFGYKTLDAIELLGHIWEYYNVFPYNNLISSRFGER